jgi:hypothetical protein
MTWKTRANLIGMVFGRLTVKEFVPCANKYQMWNAACECGNETVVSAYALTSGNTKSCGCGKSSPIRERIEDRTEIITESGCWIWMGAVNHKGYGKLRRDNRNLGAHKLSYEEFVGPVPSGMCVNPNHLFVGTTQDNIADKVKKGRQPRRESHPNAKLSESLAEEIRSLLASGLRRREIAERFGLSKSAIRSVATGKTWSPEKIEAAT